MSEIFKNSEHQVVDSVEAAFGFLKLKRADFYIGDAYTATPIINSPKFSNQNIKRLDPPIPSLDSFTFFSGKYSRLAKRYHNALVAIKKEGIYEDILNDAI